MKKLASYSPTICQPLQQKMKPLNHSRPTKPRPRDRRYSGSTAFYLLVSIATQCVLERITPEKRR
ncbi:hypothetical protein OH492_06450 [Vibrio chagasii]|nr:hypothetical protein [Vibrio chagasii]